MREDDLERFVVRLNDAWRRGRFEELRSFFHPDVVLLAPGRAEPIVGADAMVESYRRFLEAATVHDFAIDDLRVFEFGPVAVCHVLCSIDFETRAGRAVERVLEVYVVETGGDAPRVVWRTQLPAGGAVR